VIYKICPRAAWLEAEASGAFAGLAVDITDGFIHFSTASQVPATLERHFAGQTDLVLVTVDPDGLDGLRWEPSRGGDLFPHLYGPLPLSAVVGVEPIETPDTAR